MRRKYYNYINEAIKFSDLDDSSDDDFNNVLTSNINRIHLKNAAEEILNIYRKEVYPALITKQVTIGDYDYNDNSFILQGYCLGTWHKIQVLNRYKINIITNTKNIIIDPLILYLIRSTNYKINEISCIGKNMRDPSNYYLTMLHDFAPYKTGIIFDYIGAMKYLLNMSVYADIKKPIHIDATIMNILEKIKLTKEINSSGEEVLLIRGWYFESPEIFNKFVAWLNNAGFGSFMGLFASETDKSTKEYHFLKREYYDMNHRNSKIYGAYYIKGLETPKKPRLPKVKRAKDFIIEGINFSDLDDSSDDELNNIVEHNLGNILLKEIVEKYKETVNTEHAITFTIDENDLTVSIYCCKFSRIKPIKISEIHIESAVTKALHISYKPNLLIDKSTAIIGLEFLMNWPGKISIDCELYKSNSIILIGYKTYEKCPYVSINDINKLQKIFSNITVHTKSKIINRPRIAINTIFLDSLFNDNTNICTLGYIYDMLSKLNYNIDFVSKPYILVYNSKGLSLNVTFPSLKYRGEANALNRIWKNHKNEIIKKQGN